MSLANRTYSAARWTTTSTVIRAGLQLAQVAVLARILAPQDYGLMAMVNLVLSYAGLFNDMGLSTAFVQRQSISHEERSSLYWLNVVVGGILMLLVIAAAPLVAMFFHEPKLVPLTTLVATNFLVNALGQQLRMNAEKSLNFRPVALIEIFAAVIGFAIAMLTAWWWDWGVYALVSSTMVSAWLTLGSSWLFLANGWRPAWRLQWDEVRWFVRFGGGMVINNLTNHVNATVDILLGGRLLGTSLLGLYSVPRNLILQVQFMVNPIFTRVGFPLIASIQHDPKRVREIYLKTMNMTASVNTPIYVAMGVFAPEIVLLLLGDNWQDASPLLRILAIWGLLRSFGNPVGSLLFGLGHVRLAVWWNAGLLLIVPPVIWLSSKYGALGMAYSMSGLMAILFVPAWAILIRPTCGAGLWEYTQQVLIPIFCALLAGGLAWLSVIQFNFSPIRLAMGFSVGIIAYFSISWIMNRKWCLILFSAVKPAKHAINLEKTQ